MFKTFCLLAVSLFLTIASAWAEGREGQKERLTARIQKACVRELQEEYPNFGDICGCVSRNLAKGLGLEDLELITRSHEGDMSAEEALNDSKHDDLIAFDYEVTETCLVNPGWSAGKHH